MQSQLSVRLSEDLDKEISDFAKKLHLKRSDVVRIALERFLKESHIREEDRPYEKVKDLMGIISSGIPDLGEAHREYLLKQFKKHA